MGHYSHLSIEEREDIMVWWKNHESISQIARKLGRNKSSVSREIKRNGWTITGVAHLYMAQRKQLFELEEEGRVLVLEPPEPVEVKVNEKSGEALLLLYLTGRRVALERLEEIKSFIE